MGTAIAPWELDHLRISKLKFDSDNAQLCDRATSIAELGSLLELSRRHNEIVNFRLWIPRSVSIAEEDSLYVDHIHRFVDSPSLPAFRTIDLTNMNDTALNIMDLSMTRRFEMITTSPEPFESLSATSFKCLRRLSLGATRAPEFIDDAEAETLDKATCGFLSQLEHLECLDVQGVDLNALIRAFMTSKMTLRKLDLVRTRSRNLKTPQSFLKDVEYFEKLVIEFPNLMVLKLDCCPMNRRWAPLRKAWFSAIAKARNLRSLHLYAVPGSCTNYNMLNLDASQVLGKEELQTLQTLADTKSGHPFMRFSYHNDLGQLLIRPTKLFEEWHVDRLG